MGYHDQYISQHKVFERVELEGETLVVTRTSGTRKYRGKDCPTVCIRCKGLHQVRFGEETFLAAESLVVDAGPKLGVAVMTSPPPDRPVTEEERAANREEICRRIGAIYGCRCYWNNEGGTPNVETVTGEASTAV